MSDWDETKFMLDQIFEYHPAGIVPRCAAAGEPYDAFWWQVTKDKDGFVMVWYDGKRLISHHTYHYPPSIYS